mmetsp:Transcript_11929/g.25822  ORF Transcript_11929/g.25822 Transcript_11929/m.25822 type:complete len:401 (-) Transcript_11929:26-1228(-)
MCRPRRPLICLLLLSLHVAPSVTAFRLLPSKSKVVPDEENEEGRNTMSVAQKLPYLGGSIALSCMDSVVKARFNETERHQLETERGQYKKTLLYSVSESIDVGAKAAAITLAADILQSIIPSLQHVLPFQANLFEAAASIGISIWSFKSISAIKHTILNKLTVGSRVGMLEFVDRLADIALGLTAGNSILHILQVDMGMGFKSLFAASGVSAIAFSLASKGIVEQMVGGLMLQAWDAIEVGEAVKLGDGTEGTVKWIGLVETEILGPDHVPIRVPNAQIFGKKIHMYSKVSKSKVNQMLRLSYGDLPKLSSVMNDIKEEIASKCSDNMIGEPQVLLSGYEADHIAVSVSASFDFKPSSKEYAETKQTMLFCIADAIAKNDVHFALPAIQYETKKTVGIFE